MGVDFKQRLIPFGRRYAERIPFLFRYSVFLLVVLFPAATVLTRHGATGIYSILALFGLFLGWKNWDRLTGLEKLIFIGFGLYFISAALSLINSTNLARGISRMEKYVRFLLFIPAYISLRRYEIDFSRAIPASLAIGAIALFSVTVYQIHFLDLNRVSGKIDPIMFGDFASLIASLLILSAFLLHSSPLRKGLDIGLACMALYASFLSGTRNAWLLLPALFILLLFYYRDKIHIVQLLLWSILFLIMTSGIFFLEIPKRHVMESSIFKGLNNAYTFFQKDADPNTSAHLRIIIWRNSLIIFKRNPVLGTGLGDYQLDMKDLIESGQSLSSEKIIYRHTAHSSFFHSLLITGALGFAAMLLGLFIFPFYTFRKILSAAQTRNERFIALAGIVVILAYFIFGIGTTWIASHRFICTYITFLLIFLSSAQIKRSADNN